MLEKKRGLIVPIEEPREDLVELLVELDKDIIFKIKPHGLNDGTLDILKNYDNKIVYDRKLAEVGDYLEREILPARENKFDAIVTHGFMGRNNVKRCVELTREYDIDTIVVAYPTERWSYYEGYWKDIIRDAVEVGAKGVVIAADRMVNVSSEGLELLGNMYVISPGVKGLDSARKALTYGTDYLVVGRYITNDLAPQRKAIDLLRVIGAVEEMI